MNIVKLFLWMFVLVTIPVYASETDNAIKVEPNQAIVRVKGVVCSFCAYGTEKNVAKLKFIDPSQYGDGVLMDIHTQLITIVLDPAQMLDLKDLHKAIKDGGYDPVTFHLRISGALSTEDNRYFLKNKDNGQVFELTGVESQELSEGQVVDVQGHLDAGDIEVLSKDHLVKIVVDKIHKIYSPSP